MQARLQAWQRAWADTGARTDGHEVFEDLVERYRESQRAYHTTQHLAECLDLFDGVRALAQGQAPLIELALWFHDAVYDVHGSDNELRSADLAERVLREAGARDEAISAVRRLVLATRHLAAPSAPDECLLVDVDLAILGAEPERFDEYERQIRREYAFVPAPDFVARRRAVLGSFLARAQIYGSAHFHGALEARARRNLQRSLERLVATTDSDGATGATGTPLP